MKPDLKKWLVQRMNILKQVRVRVRVLEVRVRVRVRVRG